MPSRWSGRCARCSACAAASAWPWMNKVIEEGTHRIVREEKPELIFVTLSPFEGADAAAEISRRTGIP